MGSGIIPIYNMKKAIFYLTFNGIFNDTNGIATQTINTIKMISEQRVDLESLYGEIDFYTVCPEPNDKSWGYQKSYFDSIKRQLKTSNINLHLCQIDNSIDFWDVRNWKILCDNAADYILKKSREYSKSLVMCVDTPYIQVGKCLLDKKAPENIQAILILYGGAYIIDEHLNLVRLSWEQTGINAAKNNTSIKIADIGNYMTRVLKDKYGCKQSDFVPYKTGIDISAVKNLALKHDMQTDLPIIFAFGRAHPLKGFDSVIKVASKFKDKSRLVLLAPGTEDNESVILYKKLRQEYYPEMVLITDFDRELPKSIITNQNTRIVICPSYNECFSNIPLEVSVLGKDDGAILLCRDIESYTEVVSDSYNGFLFSNDSELEEKIAHILSLSDTDSKKISKNAYDYVQKNYQMIDQFKKFLSFLSFQS